MPKNCQAVHLVFRAEKIAKAVGTLAAQGPKDGRRITFYNKYILLFIL